MHEPRKPALRYGPARTRTHAACARIRLTRCVLGVLSLVGRHGLARDGVKSAGVQLLQAVHGGLPDARKDLP